jgi:hypothetical protein
MQNILYTTRVEKKKQNKQTDKFLQGYNPAPPRHVGDWSTLWLDSSHCFLVLACK